MKLRRLDFLKLRVQEEISGKRKVSELNNIRILADTSAVELYLNDGEIVFSTRYYPDREDLQLKVKGGKFMGNLWIFEK